MKPLPTPYISGCSLNHQNLLRIYAAHRVRVAHYRRKIELAQSRPTANRLRAKFGYKPVSFTPIEKANLVYALITPPTF